jgi:hypothetical protein
MSTPMISKNRSRRAISGILRSRSAFDGDVNREDRLHASLISAWAVLGALSPELREIQTVPSANLG